MMSNKGPGRRKLTPKERSDSVGKELSEGEFKCHGPRYLPFDTHVMALSQFLLKNDQDAEIRPIDNSIYIFLLNFKYIYMYMLYFIGSLSFYSVHKSSN